MLIFQPISTKKCLRQSEFHQESNGAKIKILAPKITDLEKSRIMNARYIIKRYAKIDTQNRSEVGISKLAQKLGMGFMFMTLGISQKWVRKKSGCPLLNCLLRGYFSFKCYQTSCTPL